MQQFDECNNPRCRYRFSLQECSRKPTRDRDKITNQERFVTYCPRCGRANPHYLRSDNRRAQMVPGWSPPAG